MGPWPGIEPGLGEPQSPVLTPTPPQPSKVVARNECGISIIRLANICSKCVENRDNQPYFFSISPPRQFMRSIMKRVQITVILVLLLCSLAMNAVARSVHSTSDVDIFPQGAIDSDDSWYFDDRITFTSEQADYTNSMLADNRITFEHLRPANLETVQAWSQTSPSESSFVNGAPDGSYSFTKGPVIEVTDFDIDEFTGYEIIEVKILVAFHIPGSLLQDQVRFTMNDGGVYSELVTYVNTQNPIDYMNETTWSKDITSEAAWTWSKLSNLIVTLDYVSLGNTDDTQLDIDAVGLAVIVEYPWYGTEWASVESISTGFEMPIFDVNFADGYLDGLEISSCGLTPINAGVEGSWVSEVLVSEPGQNFGRIHFDASNSNGATVEISSSITGGDFSEFTAVENNQKIDDELIIIRVTITDSCVDKIRLDYNDPSLSINGRVFGSLDGLATQYSRWKVFVNEQEAAYQLIDEIGNFNLLISIGQYLESGVSELTIKIQSWFNWDSNGSASSTLLEINSVQVTGGFTVEWDEDPVCQTIGPQYFTEDGTGILIPFLDRCIDDRTDSSNLSVSFTTSQNSLINASMVQGDIRLVVLPDQHGVATVTVNAYDEAGNYWSETFIVYVEKVDDAPVVAEFPSIIPVEAGVPTTIILSYYDIDSTGLTVTTDKSWALVDLSTSTITVTPPETMSAVPVVVSVCDQTTCVNQTLVLEVISLAELSIEELLIDASEPREGDVIPVRIYVRNSGNSEASLVSVRCQSGANLVAIKSIPLLQPGELGVVTCDWMPNEPGTQTITVELDRANGILESNEANNVQITTVEIGAALPDESSSEASISTITLWSITVIAVVLLITAFLLFAPKKIKKL